MKPKMPSPVAPSGIPTGSTRPSPIDRKSNAGSNASAPIAFAPTVTRSSSIAALKAPPSPSTSRPSPRSTPGMSTPTARPRSSAEKPESANVQRTVAPWIETTPRSSANSRSHSNQVEPTPARVAVICSSWPSGPSTFQRPGSDTSNETSSYTSPNFSYHSVLESSNSSPTFL